MATICLRFHQQTTHHNTGQWQCVADRFACWLETKWMPASGWSVVCESPRAHRQRNVNNAQVHLSHAATAAMADAKVCKQNARLGLQDKRP